MISAGRDGSARVREASTGVEISRINQFAYILSTAFSPDSRYVVSGNSNSEVIVWEAATGNEVARMKSMDWVRSVGFSRDGSM